MKDILTAAVLAATLTAASPEPALAPASATVHIRNFAYKAAALTVAPGTVVRFVNDDDEAHTVTASDRSFDSAGLDTGDSWTHRFDRTGTFAYFCALHPYMKGTVVVRSGATQ